MSVEQPGVIDAIGIEDETGIVVLTITDHLNWKDAEEHLFILQDKINAYLGFVESGEIIDKYPDAEGKPVRIDVFFKYKKLPEEALSFLEGANKVAAQLNVSIAATFLK